MSLGEKLGSALPEIAAFKEAKQKEADQIASIVNSTEKQLRHRYATKPPFRRGVHPKDHGCVKATFKVLGDLPPEYRVGIFAQPGREYQADIRFSNAATLITPPDSAFAEGPPETIRHGSRGMAVKLYGVGGVRLVPKDGEDTQDFLMINQPVFAFANVADYKILSEAIENDDANIKGFREAMIATKDAKTLERLKRTGFILECIASSSMAPPPPPALDPKVPYAFQAPPLSPLDNRYFTAAPFLFGEGYVAKFAARPVAPVSGDLGDAVKKDKDYLRTALNERLTAADAQDIEFDFQVQLRGPESFKSIEAIDTEIENACTLWPEKYFPFVTLATITIKPQQDINAPERVAACEALEFSPWHGLVEHRPLGGINRLRRTVYEKSVELRRCPAAGPSEQPEKAAAAAPAGG